MSTGGEVELWDESVGELVVVVQDDLSEEDWATIRGYVSASMAEATQRAYKSLLRNFFTWCIDAGRTPLPADEETVAAFLSSLARRGLRPSTIKMAKSAISTLHDRAKQPNPTKGDLVKSVLKGIDRTLLGGQVKQARAATGEEILAMAAPRSDGLGELRDAAILLVGFGAAMRRSEIVGIDVEHISRRRDGAVVVRIVKSKTDQTGEGADAVLPKEAGDALFAWLQASGIKSGPVFRKMGRGGRPTLHRLTGDAVREIIRARAAEAGLEDGYGPSWSGHSLRRGAATEADANGASELTIKSLGRWKSMQTVARYVDKNKSTPDLSEILGLSRHTEDPE